MKKSILWAAFVCLCVAHLAVIAAQDTTLTQRQVRDPRQLEVILEANATDAETRLTASETAVQYTDGYLIITGTALNFVTTSTNGIAITPYITNAIIADVTS